MVEIVRATPADIPALYALIDSAYRGEASRAGWTTEADLLEGQRTDPQGLADILANPQARILTARRDGKILASIMVEDRGEGVGYFGMLAVGPSAQGQGLGRRLVDAAHQTMRGFGADRARIQVFPQRDTLIAWYERLGYRQTGETAPFPYGDERFGRPLRDDLYFVVMERRLDPVLPIVTARLTLRAARPDDLTAMHVVLSDPQATQWWSTPPHASMEVTRAWLDSMIERQGSGLDLLVERDGEVIGKAGFWAPPDIGYILRPDHWGQGLATEASTAVLDRLFATTDFAEATADVDPENGSSIAMLERLGFVRTGFEAGTLEVDGVLKDSLYYALSREVWLGRSKA